MPGRWAAPPAPAMITSMPRAGRRSGVVEHAVRGAVRRHDADLERHVELGQRLGGVLHHRPVAVAAHDHADARRCRVAPACPCASHPSVHSRVRQPVCGPHRALPHIRDVRRVVRRSAGRAEDVDVADLAAGRSPLPYRCTFASGIRANRWCSRSSMLIVGVCLRTKHIGHHGHRRDRRGVAERIVEHRAQMLFELAGARAVHGPVAGVVRAHRQLVDQQPARRRSRTARRPARRPRRARRPAATPALPRRRASSIVEGRGGGDAPRRRCRRAARSAPPATPRPARTASAPPARRARAAWRPSPRRALRTPAAR